MSATRALHIDLQQTIGVNEKAKVLYQDMDKKKRSLLLLMNVSDQTIRT